MADAELIRYLDGELDGETRAALEARIATSLDATRRLDRLRGRSARLAALLPRLDPEEARVRESAEGIRPHIPPRRRGERPLSRIAAGRWAAAAAVALLALTLAVPQARAWVVERARAVAEALMGLLPAGEGAPDTAPLAPAESGGAGVGIAFAVAGDTFEVQLAQPGGRLVLRRTDASRGSVEAPGNPDVRFLVLPAGLRIEGAPSLDAAYVITLPGRVRAVRVRAGDGPGVVHFLPEGWTELDVDLGAR